MSSERWILIMNGEREIFPSFPDAIKVFRSHIKEYLLSDEDVFSANSGTPFSIGAFFAYKYRKGTITDREIALETRVHMLMLSFFEDDSVEGGVNALHAIKRPISYQGRIREFNNETTKVFVEHRGDEIVLDLYHDDGDETYLNTNAFLFNKCRNYYYFKSHQIVTTSSSKGKLGKNVDINVSLIRQ